MSKNMLLVFDSLSDDPYGFIVNLISINFGVLVPGVRPEKLKITFSPVLTFVFFGPSLMKSPSVLTPNKVGGL